MNRLTTDYEGSEGTLPVRNWAFAVALLVAEYVLAIFLFDSERLPVAKDTTVFGYLGESMPLIIVVMTATLVIGGIPPEAERREILAALRRRRRVWPLFVGQVLAYAVALAVTVFVFNSALPSEHPWLWILLWAAAGIASLILWLAAVVPKEALRPLRGPGLRALGSGIFIGLVALLAGYATAMLWEPMSRLTLDFVAFGLDLSGQAVIMIPEEFIVGTPTYNVFVDRPCSGYEGIGMITVLLGFYLFYSRDSLRFPNALLLMPIGIALIWIANSFRIMALIGVGTLFSPEIAEGGFHSAAGWLLFCGITLALVAVSERSAWFSSDPKPSRTRNRTPEGAYLLPLLVLLATGLVSTLFSAGFDYLYPLRVLTPLIPLWFFRSYYKKLPWAWSWSPIVLGISVFIMWVALEPEPNQAKAAELPNALMQMHWAAATSWLFARIVGSSLLVPVVEELAFRGYLLRRLISSDFTSVSPRQFSASAFVISSVVFGTLHGRWLAGILAGMVYALAQYRHGRLSDAIIAHAVTNGLLAVYVVVFGHWAFW